MNKEKSHLNTAVKTILKRYWWILLICVLAPIAINYALLIPAFGPVVGTNLDWLAFFGSYIAAIIPALGAFIILFIQRKDNHEENESNRQLQINVLKYQQEMQWLSEKREIIMGSVLAFHKNDLRLLSKSVIKESDIYADVKQLMDKAIMAKAKIFFMGVPAQTKEYNAFIESFNKVFQSYQSTLLDILEVSMIFSTPETKREEAFCDRVAKGYIQGNLKQIIDHINSLELFLSMDPFDISKKLIHMMPNLFSEVRSLALAYIKSEEDRIAKLLPTDTSFL